MVVLLIILYWAMPKLLNSYEFAINRQLQKGTIQPVALSHPEWLVYPLHKFQVNSSHNSYICSYQHIASTNYDSIKEVLAMGARCIELDVHLSSSFGSDSEPNLIITHGNEYVRTVSKLDINKCFDIVNEYGFHTSDPLILYLEIGFSNEKAKAKLKEIIMDKFGSRMLDPEYKLGASNHKQFTNEMFGQLLNKIIIVVTNNTSGFEGVADDNGRQIINIEQGIDMSKIKTTATMIRIYPNASMMNALSSNMDPNYFWNNKANIVALNFQSKDRSMFKNIIKFRHNSFVPIDLQDYGLLSLRT